MREGFTTAVAALSSVHQDDQRLQQEVAAQRTTHENQLAEVVTLVLALRSEFTGVVHQLQASTAAQLRLQRQVSSLRLERDLLLEELERTGAITAHLRQKYHSGEPRPSGLDLTQDSSHLSILLEKAHNAFETSLDGLEPRPRTHSDGTVSQEASDLDSGCQTARQVSSPSSGEESSPSSPRRIYPQEPLLRTPVSAATPRFKSSLKGNSQDRWAELNRTLGESSSMLGPAWLGEFALNTILSTSLRPSYAILALYLMGGNSKELMC